jgi:hypothetical protein
MPTGQPRNEAFWRTLLLDQDLSDRPAPLTLSRSFRDLFTTLLIESASAAGNAEAIHSYFDRIAVFELAVQEPDGVFPARAFIESCCRNIGLLPAVEGDGPLAGAALQAWAAEVLAGGTLVLTLLSSCLGYRRLLATDTGHLTCAPESVEVGDEVWIVSGCPTPLILRKAGDRTGSYALVGEAYVHGVMYGEAVSDEIAWESICLV